MSMTFDETTRGVWFCATIPGEQDYLLILNQVDEDRFTVDYRFRYYHSDDPFDQEDKKNWYHGEIKEKGEEEVIRHIRRIMSTFSNDYTELLRGDRSFEDFMDEFMKQDFVHAKKMH